MPTIIQDLYGEITNGLRDLKTDKVKDQIIIKYLIKLIHCSIYDVYNKIIRVVFLNKDEDIKQ